jgi:hypothetical protein
MEAFKDFVSLAAAVFLTRAELRRQTQVLRLLLGADANVDHRADHGWQRRSMDVEDIRRHAETMACIVVEMYQEQCRASDGGAPHRNPDDEEIPCPHLHLYREGYGDRWAVPLPAERFSDAGDPWLLLLEFMQFVNVTVPPDIRRGLFT